MKNIILNILKEGFHSKYPDINLDFFSSMKLFTNNGIPIWSGENIDRIDDRSVEELMYSVNFAKFFLNSRYMIMKLSSNKALLIYRNDKFVGNLIWESNLGISIEIAQEYLNWIVNYLEKRSVIQHQQSINILVSHGNSKETRVKI
jgi:hypothetical protein